MGDCQHKWHHESRPWAKSFWMCSECEMELTDSQYQAVVQARHGGRMEALMAVFQINGPSRAIARLKAEYLRDIRRDSGQSD
jgi:predicted amidophosphoribosyltransferase